MIVYSIKLSFEMWTAIRDLYLFDDQAFSGDWPGIKISSTKCMKKEKCSYYSHFQSSCFLFILCWLCMSLIQATWIKLHTAFYATGILRIKRRMKFLHINKSLIFMYLTVNTKRTAMIILHEVFVRILKIL